MPKVKVNDTLINYEKAGSGSTVALCIPGALGSALSDFSPQLKSLAGPELTLIAIDLPGYGLSRPPPRRFGPDFYTDDARVAGDLMEALGYERYHVLGWSDGGNSAVILAALRPQSVTKLVIWGANAYYTDKLGNVVKAMRNIEDWPEADRAPMLELYGEDYFRSMWTEWVDVTLAFKDVSNGTCMRETREVQCPTLVVHGAKDEYFEMEDPEYFVKNIPNAKLHVFPEAKHNLHIEYADEFNKVVAEFLAGR
ncbi:valacyclovir hydrolase-like [Amphibalanus amphitrite]|uniref:valacyclovir hydrolase-like n=1 Tax=Amphibalanus amphitrite TaxID=1232801 RepID=UPI001C920DE7|nr:valacyclovir hydrolase-like [Amphibalanus amphitrite]